MKTYTHPTLGRKAHTNGEFRKFFIGPIYFVDANRGFEFSEDDLIKLGFIEDKQEDWIEQLIKEINIWNTNTDMSKELYNRHSDFLRKAILKHYSLN